jgi:ABC-2 type transport system permease protein
MLSASLYIIVCSFRNQVRVRLQRLKQPRYLLGAIVGVAYLYFSFFARMRTSSRAATARRNRGSTPMPAMIATLTAAGPAIGGLALMVVTVSSWIMPFNSGLLDFSEPEVQFLFPAPVSRRQLLIHRLLRSQIGMLFGALIVGLVSGSSLGGFTRLRISINVWILLVTGKIYFTGVTLARTRLRSRDRRSRRVAWLPIGVITAAVVVVAAALAREFVQTSPSGFDDVLERIGRVSTSGLSGIALWPFMAIVRPLLAEWPLAYLMALGQALLVMLAIATWMLISDEAFQDAAADVAERRSLEPSRKGAATYKVRSTGWTLAPVGRPETAFAWKAAMQTLRTVDKRSMVRMLAILFMLTAVSASLGQANKMASMVGAFSLAATVFAILMAPQVLRIDMRQDLAHLELLKTWPVKASAVIRGQLLWPGVLITGAAWSFLAVAMSLSGTVLTSVSLGWRMSGGVAVALLAPSLVLSQLTIHNGVALLFPAWVPLGNQRSRGLDAMGQRLIMLGGTWLLLILSAVPGAIAGGIVWFALGRFIGPVAAVPAAAVCTVIVGMEVLLATEALGPLYEGMDVLAVERVE